MCVRHTTAKDTVQHDSSCHAVTAQIAVSARMRDCCKQLVNLVKGNRWHLVPQGS
jgi:hypothetical protein